MNSIYYQWKYILTYFIIMENMDSQEQIKKELDKLNLWSYRDFNSLPCWSLEKRNEKLEEFKENIKKGITEILVLYIVDNVWPWSEESKNLHWEIRRYINYAEGLLRYYVLKTNDKIAGVFVGCTWSSTTRATSGFMEEILKDPEINAKVKTLKAKTSDFLKKD